MGGPVPDPNAASIDPNAVGGDSSSGGDSGGGGDPFGMGGDPFGLGGGNMGLGGGGSDMSGGGRGPDISAASVANAQLQAPYDIQAGGGLRAPGGGPATDQPQPYQNASAALLGGPQRVASRTTFGQQAVAGDQSTGERTIRPGDPVSYFGKGGTPDAPISNSAWGPDPNTNLAAPDSFSSRFGASQPDASFNERFNASQPGGATRGINIPPPATPDGSRPYPPESNVGGLPAIPPRPSAPVPTPQPPPATANVPLPQPRPVGAPSIQSVTPQATPPAASPAAAATGGQGVPGMGAPQSPIEQVIRQFLQMLGIGGGGGSMGGVLSPLEHMLARALGINLPQPYPGFNPGFHSPFFPQPGPGQFPAGAVGGRSISPQPGAPPGPAPGPPGAPGNQPSALPPGRRLSDTSLPGGPWTAPSSDRPPPWAVRRADAAQPSGASANYVSQNSVAASRIAGSNTRPTPGYSTTMRDARARAFQGMDDQTKKLVAGMAASEESRDPIGPIEALMNRSAQTGIPVRKLLYNGFYSTAPRFASQANLLERSGQMDRYMAAIDAVQNGSNVLGGATDQGMAGDPNSRNPSGRVTRYGEVYNDHTPASARWRQQIQQRVMQELQAGM